MADSPLAKMQRACPGARKGPDGNWVAKCPAHEDSTPSLRFKETEPGGKLLLWCGAECPPERILGTLGLELRDLFEEKDERKARIAHCYDYRDETGKVVFQTVRFDPKGFRQRQPDGKGGWVWNLRGVREVLFRLPEVLGTVQAGGPVCIVEGEKDAEALAQAGLCGTTNAMGAGKWHADYAEPLRGARCVLIPDNDPAGRGHMEQIAACLLRVEADVRLLELAGLPPKGDVSDWLKTGKPEELRQLVQAAPKWETKANEEPGKGAFWHKNFDIERLEKVMTDPPIYYVYIYGGKVRMDSTALLAFPQFKRVVSDSLHRLPDMRNPQLNWHPYLDECFQTKMEIIIAPEDATPDAMMWYQVVRYLTMKSIEDETVLAEYRGVYSNERFLYFHGPTLHRYLSARGVYVKPSELWDLLRKHGAEAGLKRANDSKGISHVVRAWLLEKGAVGDAAEKVAAAFGLDPDGPDLEPDACNAL